VTAFAALVCADCGDAEIVSVRPGKNGMRFEQMVVTREVPDVAWCLACCVRHGWLLPFVPMEVPHAV